MANFVDIRESRPWQVAFVLALVQAILLFLAASGPQYGDSALGGVFQFALAAILYAVQLLVVAPWLVACQHRSRRPFNAVARFSILWPWLVGPVGLAAVLVANALRT